MLWRHNLQSEILSMKLRQQYTPGFQQGKGRLYIGPGLGSFWHHSSVFDHFFGFDLDSFVLQNRFVFGI